MLEHIGERVSNGHHGGGVGVKATTPGDVAMQAICRKAGNGIGVNGSATGAASIGVRGGGGAGAVEVFGQGDDAAGVHGRIE